MSQQAGTNRTPPAQCVCVLCTDAVSGDNKAHQHNETETAVTSLLPWSLADRDTMLDSSQRDMAVSSWAGPEVQTQGGASLRPSHCSG